MQYKQLSKNILFKLHDRPFQAKFCVSASETLNFCKVLKIRRNIALCSSELLLEMPQIFFRTFEQRAKYAHFTALLWHNTV